MSSKLKSLQVESNRLSQEIENQKITVTNANTRLASLREQKLKIDKEIESLQNRKEPVISEHAILRYMERVYKLDMSALKNELLPENTKKLIIAMGDGKYPVGDYKVVVENNTVVTIVV